MVAVADDRFADKQMCTQVILHLSNAVHCIGQTISWLFQDALMLLMSSGADTLRR